MPLFRSFHHTLRPRRPSEAAALLWSVVQGSAMGAWAGLLAGGASALFLWSLHLATAFREMHPLLLWGLPLAGVGIAWTYNGWGKSAEGGNNLLLENLQIRRRSKNETAASLLPFRMVPLVFAATVVTHLFGGSAGREGVATQMGGTLASLCAHPLKLSARDYRRLVRAGISGGFGAVFGTPLAGCVFGLEVSHSGRMDYADFVPCFVAACVGDAVCRAWGITHAVYPLSAPLPPMTPRFWLVVALAGVAFGLTAAAFSELTHAVGNVSRRLNSPLLRPVAGGLAVIALTYLVGTSDYLGLSLPLIARCFSPENGNVFWAAFALKLLFTAVTLGTGFKGGEVTPLFCIGATLGTTLAHLFHVPPPFFAALGFVAVFAGAANTPLACVFLGIELFGGQMALPVTATCLLAYLFSGHRGIYASQTVGVSKAHGIVFAPGTRIANAANSARIRLPRPFKKGKP